MTADDLWPIFGGEGAPYKLTHTGTHWQPCQKSWWISCEESLSPWTSPASTKSRPRRTTRPSWRQSVSAGLRLGSWPWRLGPASGGQSGSWSQTGEQFKLHTDLESRSAGFLCSFGLFLPGQDYTLGKWKWHWIKIWSRLKPPPWPPHWVTVFIHSFIPFFILLTNSDSRPTTRWAECCAEQIPQRQITMSRISKVTI